MTSPATTQTRRIAIVVMYGAILAGAMSASAGLGVVAPAGGIGFAALALAALALLLRGSRYWTWGQAEDAKLDEYEVMARNRAYVESYRVVAAAGLLGLLTFSIAGERLAVSDAARLALLWVWLALIVTLPTALLAWRDLPPAD